MAKKVLLSIIIFFLLSYLLPSDAHAVEYPLNKPNNKVGIHILFDHELPQAAKLVNSNGGDWGYVIIPIQAGDKDLEKWQKFMTSAKQYHLIPILRLATEGDPFNTKVWRKPAHEDIVDFANFLNSLDWPVKNRYVVIFNEVNRADEWGGNLNPAEYAELLSFSVSVFKSKTPDFFVITAGLDNAAPNKSPLYLNQYEYMRQMHAAVPGVFNQVDGLASHSYPNPAFAQPPNSTSTMGTGSFAYEAQLVKTLSRKELPIFITETGWSSDVVSDSTRALYYQQAFNSVWKNSNIVAVMPFLLQGSGGPFGKFSFLGTIGEQNQQYRAIQSLSKIKGAPTLSANVLSAMIYRSKLENIPRVNFSNWQGKKQDASTMQNAVLEIYKWLMRI